MVEHMRISLPDPLWVTEQPQWLIAARLSFAC
jgi:hypothetical protein